MGKWLGRFHSRIKVSMALCNGRMRTGSCCCHCRSLLIEVTDWRDLVAEGNAKPHC